MIQMVTMTIRDGDEDALECLLFCFVFICFCLVVLSFSIGLLLFLYVFSSEFG